ncbi:MAG: acyl carrier protein [Gemmataceae bacterium]
MNRATLRKTLIDLLESETGTRNENLTDDTILTEGLGLDSIDLVSLIVQVENRLRIKIETDELKKISRVGDLLDLLSQKVAASQASV